MVLIARAPINLTLGGNTVNTTAYYAQQGGLVIGTTISYYVYTILTPTPWKGIRIISADPQYLYEYSPQTDQDLDWRHDLHLPQAIVQHFDVNGGLDLYVTSQVPARSGLGVAGAIAVSMIKALAFHCGLDLGPEDIAELACSLDTVGMDPPMGPQDPYAAAYGGLNTITFSRDNVTVDPMDLSPTTHERLERGLMLFHVEGGRQSTAPSSGPGTNEQDTADELIRKMETLTTLGIDVRSALARGDMMAFGQSLHHSWIVRHQVSKEASTSRLDQCYQVAREKGALGGRATHAGESEFLILYCPEDRQNDVEQALKRLKARRHPVRIETQGVQIIHTTPRTVPIRAKGRGGENDRVTQGIHVP